MAPNDNFTVPDDAPPSGPPSIEEVKARLEAIRAAGVNTELIKEKEEELKKEEKKEEEKVEEVIERESTPEEIREARKKEILARVTVILKEHGGMESNIGVVEGGEYWSILNEYRALNRA